MPAPMIATDFMVNCDTLCGDALAFLVACLISAHNSAFAAVMEDVLR
jgi:hypothetical protein